MRGFPVDNGPAAPTLAAIQAQVRRAQRVLLLTHVTPDGDAIGSLLGMGWLLQDQGKEVTLACEDPVPDNYHWLPGSADIVARGSGSYHLAICLDCSDPKRMGQAYSEDLAAVPLINIDHHVTNTRFGTLNWVDPACVATAQMVLALADQGTWKVTADVATCLLTGLVTDTRSFRTANVDEAAMRATLRLMQAGASLPEITRRALDQRPLAVLRLWGQAIERSQLQGGVLWTEVTRDLRHRWALHENDESGLANFLSSVREAQIVVVFAERDNGSIDVGLRAVPAYNVAGIALSLGGGGHPQAAGCTLEGELAHVRRRVLDEIWALLDRDGVGRT
jgi:bifunctional oligoribonuclease and PAP phosphatase NrnA